MESARRCCVFLLVLGTFLGASRIVSGKSALDAAFKMILSHSPELDTDHIDHLTSLEQKEQLTRAIKWALKSMNKIAEDTDLENEVYRRVDGIGNNLKNPMWGASLHKELRLTKNSYDDGVDVPRYRATSGNLLPSARDASIKCFLPDKENSDFLDPYISQMFMQFGQFLDHDVILTEQEAGSECCERMNPNGTHPDMFSSDSCFPIQVAGDDRFFKDGCMSARRSLGINSNGVREQINGVTSYVDMSQVYGPAQLLCDELRSFEDGKLRVKMRRGYESLPLFGKMKCHNESMKVCPHAGDPRVNVFPGLTIIHTIFHREHNRLAGKLKEVNPHWDDEKLFQEARKILIAINQKITYDEYLPKVLGDDMMSLLGISDPWKYDPDIDASISSVFGAAAFRFGHSQINGELIVKKDEEPKLSEVYFRPHIGVNSGEWQLKNIIVNQARSRAQQADQFFSTQVTDHLFEGIDAVGESFDLPALAVQRCRDHGLPSYLDYVDLAYKSLAQRAAQTGRPCTVAQLNLPVCLLKGVYESSKDVDLFVGAMYENHVPGGLVGPTFAYLIGEQFYRLKFGDRFWYETDDPRIGFTKDQLTEIKERTSLAHVLCQNSILENIHPLPMERRRGEYNAKRECTTYTDIDFSKWAEPQT